MKRAIFNVPLHGVLFGLLVVCLAGCATRPQVDWDARIGAYTYDDAILEMGPPDKSATLSDDSVVAEWMIRRGRYYGSVPAYGYAVDPYGWPGPYPAYGAGYYSASRSPDTFLRLFFDPEHLLTSAQEVRR